MKELRGSELSSARILGNVSLSLAGRGSRSDLQSLEIREERSISRFFEVVRPRENVGLASATKSRSALVEGRLGGSKYAASIVGDDLVDLDEDVTLEEAAGCIVSTLEGVAVVVLPDVVDGVQEGAATERGGATSGAEDVVVLQSNLVVFSDHLEGPVVVLVSAASRVGAFTIDEVVGQGHTGAGIEAEYIVLTTRASGLYLD